MKAEEIIVIDDGSEEDPEEVIRSFGDDRIRLIRNRYNSGVAYSLNKGMREVKTEVILRMDADDFSVRTRAERQIRLLNKNPGSIIGGDCYSVVSARKGWRVFYPLEDSECRGWLDKMRSPLCHPAVAYRKETIESIGGYREDAFPAEDYECWTRMSKAGIKIMNSGEVEIIYKVHPGSVSLKKKAEQSKKVQEAHKAWKMWRDELEFGSEEVTTSGGRSLGIMQIFSRRWIDKELTKDLDRSERGVKGRIYLRAILGLASIVSSVRYHRLRKMVFAKGKL